MQELGNTTRGAIGKAIRWSAWIFSLIPLLSVSLAHAGSAASPRFEPLGIDQGLPQESVTTVVQDAHGFIWLGTQAGLTRFDAYKTQVFKNAPHNSKSIGDSWAYSLLSDRQGNLWVGTRKGLDRFDFATGSFVHYDQVRIREGNNGINALVEDGAGTLWLGGDQGLLKMDIRTGRVSRPSVRDQKIAQTLDMKIASLARSKDGTIWAGTPLGVLRLSPGGAAQLYPVSAREATGSKSVYIRALYATDSNELWVGTLDEGLQRWKVLPHDIQPVPLPESSPLKKANITAIQGEPGGALWIGTLESGLFHFDPATGHTRRFIHDPTDRYSIGDDYVTTLALDRSGCLWVGSWGGGASHADLGSSAFERWDSKINSPVRLSSSKVYGFAGDRQGNLWFATIGGGVDLYERATGQTRVFRHREDLAHSLNNDKAMNVAVDHHGQVWVLTQSSLGRMDPKSGIFTPIPLPTGDSKSSLLLGLYLQADGNALWINSRVGLFRLDLSNEQITQFHHSPTDKNSLADDFVTSVLEDKPGQYWIGTFGGGLDHLDLAHGRFTHYRHADNQPDSLSSNRVQTLTKDSHGTLWVGTSSGFSRAFRRADHSLGFRSYTAKNWTNSDSIGAIQEDTHGKLWISTTSGLARFDPASGAFTLFDAHDGITPGSFFVGSTYKDSEGKLYFGGVNGVTVVSPDKLTQNKWTPTPVLTDFCVMNQCLLNSTKQDFTVESSQGQARLIRIPPHTVEFSIAFSLLHFAAPGKNRFEYQLEGFNKGWVQSSAERRLAVFTNLAPGAYTFRVRAANKDGVWSERPLELKILIEPEFWQTRWFAAAVIALLIGVLLLGLRLRTRALRRQSAELRKKVAEQTVELKSALLKLEQASLTDPLTGLYNRRFLDQHIDRDLAISVRKYEQARTADTPSAPDADIALFLIDIDHFKKVNDRYGHSAGDAVLIDCATRLKATFRDTDYLVRWGGEEFLAVARGTQRAHAAELGERIRQAITQEAFVTPDGQKLNVSASIGITCFPALPETPGRLAWTDLVNLCDAGLYAAKASGRDGWVYIGLENRETSPIPLNSSAGKERGVQDILSMHTLDIQTSFSREEVKTWLAKNYMPEDWEHTNAAAPHRGEPK